MNKFDKKIFKAHYGKIYFRLMYWGLGIALLCIQLAYYPSFFKITSSSTYIGIFATLMSLSLISVGVSGYFYFVCMNKAKNQQVWIDKNKVYMRVEKRIKKKIHTHTYCIQNIEDSEIQSRYIRVKGKIQLKEEVENQVNTRQVNELIIPRSFTNEEKVVRVLRIA
ncbi:MAG: hypothetical protein Q4C49_01540 [Bacillota bacterium]|nr:hypothetical protein [Bacillota bacterium]